MFAEIAKALETAAAGSKELGSLSERFAPEQKSPEPKWQSLSDRFASDKLDAKPPTENHAEVCSSEPSDVDSQNSGQNDVAAEIDNCSEQTMVIELNTRNSALEGQTHPETGVPFERKTVTMQDGTKAEGVFPQFDSVLDVYLPEELYQATDAKQFAECNRQLKERCDTDPKFREQFSERQLEYIDSGRIPNGYTWHHNEDTGKMQLVNYEQHWRTGHTGGQSVWGGGSENR